MTKRFAEGHVVGCGWPAGTTTRDPADLEHYVLMNDGQRIRVPCAAEPGIRVTLMLEHHDGIDDDINDPDEAMTIADRITRFGATVAEFSATDVVDYWHNRGQVVARAVVSKEITSLHTAGVVTNVRRGVYRLT